MTNEEKMSLIKLIFQTIFDVKRISGDITEAKIQTNTGLWAGRTFVNGKLRGFDFTVNDNGLIKKLRMLEQNPYKMDSSGKLSHYAVMACKGCQIAWLIDTSNNEFLGRMQDGEFVPSQTQVVMQAAADMTQQSPTSTAAEDDLDDATDSANIPEDAWEAPDIPENVSIPDWVLNEVTSEEPPEWADEY